MWTENRISASYYTDFIARSFFIWFFFSIWFSTERLPDRYRWRSDRFARNRRRTTVVAFRPFRSGTTERQGSGTTERVDTASGAAVRASRVLGVADDEPVPGQSLTGARHPYPYPDPGNRRSPADTRPCRRPCGDYRGTGGNHRGTRGTWPGNQRTMHLLQRRPGSNQLCGKTGFKIKIESIEIEPSKHDSTGLNKIAGLEIAGPETFDGSVRAVSRTGRSGQSENPKPGRSTSEPRDTIPWDQASRAPSKFNTCRGTRDIKSLAPPPKKKIFLR